jgi:hypothetical protein
LKGVTCMKVILGNNVIENCDAALVVKGTEVFRLRNRESDDRLVCDFDVRDKNGIRIVKVAKNNVVYAAPGYEIRHLPRESCVQDSNGNILVRVQETANDEIRIIGDFWVEGHRVLITKDELVSGSIILSGNTVSGFGKAISIEPNSFSIGTR